MPSKFFEFGSFRLESDERRLWRDHAAVPLTPKAFDLLCYLVEHPDRLLKKEELLEHLWPGVFVEEVNLAQNISAIRRALGGEGRGSFIQTVAGSGYRFVAPVHRVGETRAIEPAMAETPSRKRLLVLPFRMLKSDLDLDFLAYSLPDALTAELSNFNALIVRSSLIAARFAADAPDLPRIAKEAQVDFVVSGTVLRVGNEVRVSGQLSDAAAGTLLWSHTVQVPVGDLFRLQDSLLMKIAGSLARPLTETPERPHRDVPATARAYELFLRANAAGRMVTGIILGEAPIARDLYLQALRDDPNFAPAWARLARIYRVLGKHQSEQSAANIAAADDALQRALAINPNLVVAHSLLAQIDVDRGDAEHAMLRLLELLRRRGPQAEVFAGLVQACRFCGLLAESEAAYAQVQRVDPAVDTGVMHTYFLQRRYQDAIDEAGVRRGYVWGLSMAALGRGDEAIPVLAGEPSIFSSVHALLLGKRQEAIDSIINPVVTLADPEALYYGARLLAHLAATEPAIAMFERAVRGGYACYEVMRDDEWLDSLRSDRRFTEMLELARARHESAASAFLKAGGPQLLGMN